MLSSCKVGAKHNAGVDGWEDVVRRAMRAAGASNDAGASGRDGGGNGREGGGGGERATREATLVLELPALKANVMFVGGGKDNSSRQHKLTLGVVMPGSGRSANTGGSVRAGDRRGLGVVSAVGGAQSGGFGQAEGRVAGSAALVKMSADEVAAFAWTRARLHIQLVLHTTSASVSK